MSDHLHRELLAVADRAAAAATELVHDQRPDTLRVTTKSSATDQVTHMDRAAEDLIREIILRHRPFDTIVGEEGGTTSGSPPAGDAPTAVQDRTEQDGPGNGSGRVTWWVDPIDGTTNYVYDHPGYGVSIAAAVDGVTVAGVVSDPTHGRTYRALVDSGATCEERGVTRTLALGPPPPLEEALVATGFGYEASRRAAQGRVVAELLPRIRDIRRMGAAAVDLCSVAAGRVDAFYEAGLSPWDLAAGALVATEAGARLGSIDGGPVRPGSVLAAHPGLFEPLRDLLVSLGADSIR